MIKDSFKVKYVYDSLSVCIYEIPYAWRGYELQMPGTYVDTIKTIDGKDSIITFMQFSYTKMDVASEVATIVKGDTYLWRGKQLYESGTYRDTAISEGTCGKIYTLTLTVLNTSEELSACRRQMPELTPLFDYSDFEKSHIECFYGVYDLPYKYTGTTSQINLQTGANILSAQIYPPYSEEVDPIGKFSVLCAPNIPSIRIGTGHKGNGDAYAVNIPFTPKEDSALIEIHYAVEANTALDWHYPNGIYKKAQPVYFQIQIFDEHGDTIPCANLQVYEYQNNFWTPTEGKTFNATICYFHDWDSYVVDLSSYVGQRLTIKAVTTDCSTHSCSSMLYLAFTYPELQRHCCDVAEQVIYAPYGYEYEWRKGSLTAPILGTQDIIGVPADGGKYYCTLIKPNTTCSVTLQTNADKDTATADFSYQLYRGYCADTIYVFNYSTAKYVKWDFGGALLSDGTLANESRIVDMYQPNEPLIFNKYGVDSIRLFAWQLDSDCYVDTAVQNVMIEGGGTYQIWFDTLCTGDVFVYRGDTLPLPSYGDYTFVNELYDVSCFDTLTLNQHIHVAPSFVFEMYDTICNGATYLWHNQTLSQTGIYYDSLVSSEHCDSIYVLFLYAQQPDTTIFMETICNGETYWWNGIPYENAGLYEQTLSNRFGCDSVVRFILKVRPANQMPKDSVVYNEPPIWDNPYWDTIKPIIDPAIWDEPYVSHIEYDTIWEGESKSWRGALYTQTGVYRDTLRTIYGCDSMVVFLNLQVNELCQRVRAVPQYDTICFPDSMLWQGRYLTQSGTYYDTLLTSSGCDSIVTLILTAYHIDTLFTVDTVCEGYPYYWRGETLYSTTNDTIVKPNVFGCDSVFVLNLHYRPTMHVYDTIQLLCGDTVSFYRQPITETGDYTMSLTSLQTYCDSVHHLNAHFYRGTKDEYATLCDSSVYHWRGKICTQSGVYLDTVVVDGCDSVYRLHLQMYYASPDTSICLDTICAGQSYTWRGKTYASTGVYHDTLINQSGCDSILTLKLFVNPELKSSDSIIRVTLCNDQGFVWQGKTYSAPGTYSQKFVNAFGCDSIVFLEIKVVGSESISTTSQQKIDPAVWDEPYVDFSPEYISDPSVWDNPYWLEQYIKDTVNYGESYYPGGPVYYESGQYVDTLVSAYGCDSIIYLDLYVRPYDCGTFSSIDTTFIYDSLKVHPFMWFEKEYVEPGVYNDTILNTEGCDSIGSLLLRVIYTDSVTECSGMSHTFTTPWGDYTVAADEDSLVDCLLMTAELECLVRGRLLVHHKSCSCDTTYSTTYKQIEEADLPTFQWNGMTVPQVPQSETRDTTLVFPTMKVDASCDSIATLKLHVLSPCELPSIYLPIYYKQ